MHLDTLRSWSLRSKLTLFLSAIFLVSIWSLVLYASKVLHKEMENLAGEQQFSTVSFIAAEIDEALTIRLQSLEQISSEIKPAMLQDPASLQAFLEQRPLLQILFNGGIFATGIDGTAIADVPLSTKRIGVNYLDRTSVSSPIDEGKTMVGRPVMGKKLGAPVFSISTPIRDTRGTVIGALLGTINLNQPSFLDEITNNRYGKTGGYLLVAPQHGVIVTATDKRRIMTPIPTCIPLVGHFAKGYEGSGVFINTRGEEMLGSAKGVPAAGWYVVAVLPTAEAFAPIHNMKKHLILAAIFLTFFAGGVTWWIARRLLAPLFTTVATLTAMTASGQQPQPLPIVRQDEIGKLIHCFNLLLETLAQREQARRESEDRYRSILNASPDDITITDMEGQLLLVSPAGIRMFGYDREEQAYGHYITEFLPPEERERALSNFKLKVQGIISGPDEYRGLRKDGSLFDMEVNSALIRDDAGRPLNVVFVIRDISERKKVEADMLESRENYQRVFNNQIIAICIFDLETLHIIDINNAHIQLYGYSREELLDGMISTDLSAEPESSVASIRLASSQRTFFVPLRQHRKKDGTIFPVEIVGEAFVRNGRWVMLGMVRDISERLQVEQERQTSLAEKEVLLREVHHRVKNNMAAIIGLLDLHMQAMDDPQTRMIMTDLSTRVRAMSLVHEKLYCSESLSKVDFQEYLQALVSHLRTSFGSPSICCEIEAQGVEMPLDLAVPCGMIINELVINALKYAFPGKRPGQETGEVERIQVAVRYDSDAFTLSVADNGVGLPPEFDLNTTTTLGLSLVQMLGQHQLDGRYQVHRIGGTQFTLTFSHHPGETTYA